MTKTRKPIALLIAMLLLIGCALPMMCPPVQTAAAQNVYTTATGSKYHGTKQCRGLNNAKKIYTTSLADAKKQGLEPCKLCNGAVKQTVTVVKLNKTKLTLTPKKKATLKVTGTKAKVTWASSNKKVVKVSSKGKVQALKKGTAKIVARVNGKKLTCKVTVK